ncbi:MAG: DEAD/DEAH box helicase [Alphaproteobacteria bacterium]|nr:DEAD/DEAH box helicase [Alphaproteobacteria bacterium]
MISAVLGPTNTGKTHLAIERMLGYQSGMIGFPLRLLARENYDRIVKRVGRYKVALVTGEEKLIPQGARYWICTVESMPLDVPVEFLAVDEIQLCADPERGHIFTGRLLGSRGLEETMFLGAETIRPLIKRLVPDAKQIARPRFSTLTYTGYRKVTRLPRRSAVVAFSAAEVYQLAELVRRQRGGTAVVLGALSPRARNAQVEMYQSGEVDYLVATDAIGMGLNMDLDHVAFARLRKYDGKISRALRPQELAQIAGRAGRHMNDGTFGVTGEAGSLDEEIVDRIETHSFDDLKQLYWRTATLNFRSLGDLRRSLEKPVPDDCLIKKRDADDQEALEALSRNAAVNDRAVAPDKVRLLWEVCQVPDFRKLLTDSHVNLLAQLFIHLTDDNGTLPADWVDQQVKRIDRTDGDIETLVQRIAHIRTWSYVSHRNDWLDDAAHWQGRARAIEERLSDALHDRLTQRFVDRRAAMLTKALGDGIDLIAAVTRNGEVKVEGHYVGRLDGLTFIPDAMADKTHEKALMTAARRALSREMPMRVRRLVDSPDDAFRLREDSKVLWHDHAVGRLVAGAAPDRPRVVALRNDLIEGSEKEEIERRLQAFVQARVRDALAPLYRAEEAKLEAGGRGLVFELLTDLGMVPAERVKSQLAHLDKADRGRLTALGVRFGTETVYMPALMRAPVVALKTLLWATHQSLDPVPPAPDAARVSLPVEPERARGFYQAAGFVPVGRHAIRVDILERFAAELRRRTKDGPAPVEGPLAALIGVGLDDLEPIVRALGGYRLVKGESEDGKPLLQLRRARRKAKQPKRAETASAQEAPAVRRPGIHNPFAVLSALKIEAMAAPPPARRKRRQRKKQQGKESA